MHKVKLMQASPMSCMMCGRGNTPDDPDTMDDLWFLDTERDLDWGDTAYICKYCCDKVGLFAGLVGMQELAETQAVVKAQAKRIHDLEAKLAARQRRLNAVAAGEQALQRTVKEHGELTKLKTRTKKKTKVAVDD